jgi:hypothetical protein
MPMIESYLLSGTGCERTICYGCAHAVKKNPVTDRWFITMGHPGFNSRANNGSGYITKQDAEKAIRRYGGKGGKA